MTNIKHSKVDIGDLEEADDRPCGGDMFRCENSPCIWSALRCNGVVDCPFDTSDELDCSHGTHQFSTTTLHRKWPSVVCQRTCGVPHYFLHPPDFYEFGVLN